MTIARLGHQDLRTAAAVAPRRYRVKGKFLLFAIALGLPLAAAAQDSKPAAAPTFERYELGVSAAYSSANQAKGSSALVGGSAFADYKLKPWFGAEADFGYYGASYTSVQPTMTTFLAGPSLFLPSDKLIGNLHVLFGGAHTGNVGATPNISFAWAVGGGFEYQLRNHFYLKLAGDGIFSSFVLDPTNQHLSANLRVNPRATAGVAYHF